MPQLYAIVPLFLVFSLLSSNINGLPRPKPTSHRAGCSDQNCDRKCAECDTNNNNKPQNACNNCNRPPDEETRDKKPKSDRAGVNGGDPPRHRNNCTTCVNNGGGRKCSNVDGCGGGDVNTTRVLQVCVTCGKDSSQNNRNRFHCNQGCDNGGGENASSSGTRGKDHGSRIPAGHNHNRYAG